MRRFTRTTLALAIAGMSFVPVASATTYDLGYLSYDVTNPGTAAQFDIVNLTGANSSLDPSFPVTSTIAFSSLSLTVTFASGPSETFGSSYFTADPDGSFDGIAESITSGQPSGFKGATGATLSGSFSPTTVTLYDGTTVTLSPGFTASISNLTGLADGNLGLIDASTSGITPPPPVPEPESLVMVGTGLAALAGFRRRFRFLSLRKTVATGAVLAVGSAILLAPASASASTVKLTTYTTPAAGQSGQTFVNVTASSFPTGVTPSAVTVYLNSTCSTTGATSTKATSLTAIAGTTERVQFEIPAGLPTGNYFVSLSGTGSAGSFTSNNCAQISVTLSSVELAACVPTSSLAVTVGSNVDAFVPFGYWDGGTEGISRVALEGSDPAKTFSTTGLVNSCASNSSTGEVVCTENNQNVDLIKGDVLSTIVSSSDQDTGFSGGSCQNCGVGIDAVHNTAVIAMGYSGGSSSSGVQTVKLSDNSKATPFGLQNRVSEDISIDPGRNLILSPGEGGYYDLLKTKSDGSVQSEYANYIGGGTEGGELDSAAEDCTTGIAMAAVEFTDQIYITDLTQAKFTAPSGGSAVGTWTAPGQFLTLNGGSGDAYSAGTCGLSSAPGAGHLAVVTGEFGGSAYSALKLPSTAGSGTPTLADYAYVSQMPSLPDGTGFNAGYDPHTITAYTSPNTGKSYAVFVDYYTGPSYLGVVDLACVLSQPRDPGTHNVTGTAASCTRYVKIP